MPTLGNQQRRRRAIAELLQSHVIRRQSELVRLLRAEGLESTQSQYQPRPARPRGGEADDRVQLARTGVAGTTPMRSGPWPSFFRDIRPAGPNLLVIATAVGAAQRVCVTLDRANWPEVVGTISGDDTIFVATTGAGAQRRLVARLQESLAKAPLQ